MTAAPAALEPAPAAPGMPPGPRSAAATGARWIHNPVELLESCRSRFGDAFTLEFPGAGENVFVSDPATIKEIFARDRRGNGMPSSRDLLLKPVMGPRSVLLLEGDEHMRIRKLMLPPFHGERMRAYTEAIEAATERELANWRVGETFALHASMQAITLEVILSAVFGVSEGERRDDLRRRLVAILETGQSAKAQVFGLALMRLGARGPYRAFERRLTQADDLLLGEIAERRADPALAEREDILSMLVAARFDDGSAMTDSRDPRPADDPAARRPRDHRDLARLGVRPPLPRPRAVRAPARGARRRRRGLPRRGLQRDPPGAPGDPGGRPPPRRAAAGRRLRGAGRASS